MARTNLLRSIVRLGRQLRCARHRRIPIDAILERAAASSEDRRNFTRRRFITTIGVAGAGLALPGKLRAFSLAPSQPRIAIVGGGIAGLNCALTLADRGVRSTVYEAGARIGGRMFSNNSGYWNDEQVTEWCGELIDTDHETIQSLAARFALPLDDLHAGEPNGTEETYFFDGALYPRSQAVVDFAPVFAAVQNDADAADYPTTYNTSTPAGRWLDRMSVWDWIETRVPGGHRSRIGQLLNVAYAIEYGAGTREQSSLNLVYALSGSGDEFEIFGDSDERYHVRGGNELVPRAIAAHLDGVGLPIQTGKRLAAISRRPDGAYRLIFESTGGTSEVVADLVVLTLPFAVLRKLDYARARFDVRKHKAIQELGRGHNGKLQLQFDARIWNQRQKAISNGTSFADTGYQNTWEPTRGQPGTSGILNNYTGGAVTDSMQSPAPFAFVDNPHVQRDAMGFLSQVNPVFPGLANFWNGKATSSRPHLSPFFKCSYSFWRVGQYQTFGGYEGVRQENVFFAGEHTSIDFQGFMEGAAAEGARAAQEILWQQGLAGRSLTR